MEVVNRILVLDDEAELRNMLQRFLTSQGFRVRAVADGKQLGPPPSARTPTTCWYST